VSPQCEYIPIEEIGYAVRRERQTDNHTERQTDREKEREGERDG